MDYLPFTFAGHCVSWGTLRTCDLLEACADFIRSSVPDEMLTDQIRDTLSDLKEGFDSEEGWEPYVESLGEDVEYILHEELFPFLGEISPPWHYFGSHPGDGSDIGFYFDGEGFQQDVWEGSTVASGDELPESKEGDSMDPDFFAVINERGNVDVYEWDGVASWVHCFSYA
jgi:hypothetical protein